MKQGTFEIIKNTPLTDTVFRLDLAGDTSAVTAPGQFVEIALPGLYLRRPISVFDKEEGRLSLIIKRVGAGTEALAGMKTGTLDILTGLGNGYDLAAAGESPLLIGGGVGVPPLYLLAKELLKKGAKPSVILGFNTKSELFCEEEFKTLGIDTTVATADGSYGVKGFVTDAMRDKAYSYFYACGPVPMLKALTKAAVSPGEMSLEARMGCGFGACMGCTVKTAEGPKRVCKEGPVFKKEALVWED